MNSLGVYYHENSFWHHLDPRPKILVVLASILILTQLQDIWVGLGIIIIGLLYITAKLPLHLLWNVLLKFKWLLLIILIVHLFFPTFTWKLMSDNFLTALLLAIKYGLIILQAMWLSYVTKPLTLIDGLNQLLRPLERLNIPVSHITLMISLTWRFIPELLDESENIFLAQRLRGIAPGFSWKKSGVWIKSSLIPIFVSSIRKSTQLALAMEARGFHPGKERSTIEELQLKKVDYLIIGVGLMSIILTVILSILY